MSVQVCNYLIQVTRSVSDSSNARTACRLTTSRATFLSPTPIPTGSSSSPVPLVASSDTRWRQPLTGVVARRVLPSVHSAAPWSSRSRRVTTDRRPTCELIGCTKAWWLVMYNKCGHFGQSRPSESSNLYYTKIFFISPRENIKYQSLFV